MSRPGSWRDVTPDPVELDDAEIERMRLEDYGIAISAGMTRARFLAWARANGHELEGADHGE